MLNEEWRAVDGWPYEISDLGRVKRATCGKRTYPGRVRKLHMWGKYLAVSLHREGRMKTFPVHHLVAAAFLGDRPVGFEINHKSGVKTENQAANLEYLSSSDNKKHAFRIGLAPADQVRGENQPGSKLTEEAVREIRQLAGIHPQRVLAARFGVSGPTISDAINRKTWRHVT